jgi:hypothetical protein
VSPSLVPHWGPCRERCHSPEPSLIYSSGSPVKEPSLQVFLRSPIERETLHIQSLLLLSLEVPSKRTSSPGSPMGPLWKEMPLFRAFLYMSFRTPSRGALFHLYFRVPGKWAPPTGSSVGPYRERCPFLELSFTYLPESPIDRVSRRT